MIFRGIEARSDESLAKVPALKEEERQNLQTETFLVSTPDIGTIKYPENVIEKGPFIFNVQWPRESFS